MIQLFYIDICEYSEFLLFAHLLFDAYDYVEFTLENVDRMFLTTERRLKNDLASHFKQ